MKTLAIITLLLVNRLAAEPATAFIEAWESDRPLPRLSSLVEAPTLSEAYDVQREWVTETLAPPGAGGVKGGYVTPAALELLGIEEPLAGILRGAGRFEAEVRPTLLLADYPGLKIETEIGFVVGTAITEKPDDLADFKRHIRAIVPVVELPAGAWDAPEGTPLAADVVAMNIASAAYIVGAPVDPDTVDPAAVTLRFVRDGELLHEGKGADNWQGPWKTAAWLADFALRQGIELQPGQLIICGALGKIHIGEAGAYKLDAGSLGIIEFTLKD